MTARGFVGYERRDVPEPDAELTRVGPGTLCGEWLRRSWQPIALAGELGETPLALRVLGEDLVLFRDRAGRLGLLHRHCSHRGASLEYGIIMERGISCCYHGWHYDVDGTILATPAEPTDRIRGRLFHGAYPTHEQDGVVFAYLGPPELRPRFPVFDVNRIRETHAIPFSLETPCNWLQVYENTQDPVHVVYLHTRMSGAQFGDASGADQVLDYRETPIGMVNVQTRRWNGHYWTRMTETILPNGNQTGAIWEAADREKVFQRSALLRWMMPMDDTHTLTIGWRFYRPELDPAGLGDPGAVGRGRIDFIGQTGDRPYAERQRQPGDYEVQVSQRPIAVHALENLATSDRGVSMLRRLVRKGIRALPGTASARELPEGRDGLVNTYCQDTVWPASDRGTATARLGEFGNAVADTVIDSAPDRADERCARLRAVLESRFGTPDRNANGGRR